MEVCSHHRKDDMAHVSLFFLFLPEGDKSKKKVPKFVKQGLGYLLLDVNMEVATGGREVTLG